MSVIPTLATRDFLETLNTVEHDWGTWVDDLKLADQETQDLLHEIELTRFDVQRGYRLAKQLQEVRQRRRELKDKMEILGHLKNFLENNKQLKINLYKTLSIMERTENHHEHRSYWPKVRTDITLAERGCDNT